MSQASSAVSTNIKKLDQSRWAVDHKTIIQAPLEFVWEHMTDVASWSWNPCIRLNAEEVLPGKTGKVSIALPNKRWQVRNFIFDEVDRRWFTLSWTTLVGQCRITNVMKLSPFGTKATNVMHTLRITGVFAGLRFRLPLKKVMNHPMCIDEALKHHVESKHFNMLLATLSSREMSVKTDGTASLDMSESCMAASYWESSPTIRQEIVNKFLGDETRFRAVVECSREVSNTTDSDSNKIKAAT